MGKLVVLSRNHLQVVCGYVESYTNQAITIKNDVWTKQGTKVKKRIILETTPGTAEKLKLKVGAGVIATIKANPHLHQFFLGKNDEADIVKVETYAVRYTGAFDFKQFQEEAEQHVFCGKVTDIKPLKGGSLIAVSWTRQGETSQRFLFSKIPIEGKVPKSGVFVTGPAKNTSLGTIFPLKTVSVI